MDAIFWLAAGNAIVWLGLGAYLALLGARQRQLLRQLKNLELEHEQDE